MRNTRSLRLLYLVFCHIAGWLSLLTQTQTAKEVQILVLRRQNPTPRLDPLDAELPLSHGQLLAQHEDLGVLVMIATGR